jgi:hypothetical protein
LLSAASNMTTPIVAPSNRKMNQLGQRGSMDEPELDWRNRRAQLECERQKAKAR